jgi:hypothetical protein
VDVNARGQIRRSAVDISDLLRLGQTGKGIGSGIDQQVAREEVRVVAELEGMFEGHGARLLERHVRVKFHDEGRGPRVTGVRGCSDFPAGGEASGPAEVEALEPGFAVERNDEAELRDVGDRV